MLRTTLRGYQSEAVRRALHHDGFAFFPEQRTGKTLTTLAVVDDRKPDILFIVCPKKAVGEWERQLPQHLDVDWKMHVEIVHYEMCCRSKKDRRYYRKLFRHKWQDLSIFIVCDESHRIKKRGSMQSRMVRSLGKLATWRLALTGTPIANGIQDAWAQFEFIMTGIFGKWDDFCNMNLKFGGFEFRQIVGHRRLDQFNKIFNKYSYRITFQEARQSVGIPGVKIRREKVMFDLKPSSWTTYRELEEELETEVDGVMVSTPLVLTLTGKLQQLAGGFLINDVRTPGRRKPKRTVVTVGAEKLLALEQLLTRPRLTSRKIVICARYRHELGYIAAFLEGDRTYKLVAGGHEWDGKFDTDVVLLQVQSGVAVDMSAANTYIFYSWDFSYINYEQSRFRVMSFDTEQVNYYFLMARDTVDEDIYEAVTKKKNLATLVCDRYRKRDGKANR